jgi:hypothetical protein
VIFLKYLSYVAKHDLAYGHLSLPFRKSSMRPSFRQFTHIQRA